MLEENRKNLSFVVPVVVFLLFETEPLELGQINSCKCMSNHFKDKATRKHCNSAHIYQQHSALLIQATLFQMTFSCRHKHSVLTGSMIVDRILMW